MKIAVTVTENSPQSEVDQRFGRARGFLIYDTEANSYDYIDNSDSDQMTHGAGTNAAQKMVDAGVNVVLTGQVGPNAYEVMSSEGIEVITGVSGTAEEAIKAYMEGSISGRRASGPTVGVHGGMGGTGSGNPSFGPGFGRGMGMGRGMGRGMGMGMGRGMGRGMGMGRGRGMGSGSNLGNPGGGFYGPPTPPGMPPFGMGFGPGPGWWGTPWDFGWSPEAELEYLKNWRDEVRGLLDEIEERIRELEEG